MSSTDLVVPTNNPPPPSNAVEISPINAVSIRESSFGQYLESINTRGTWFETVQQTLGFEPKPITALDVFYSSLGIMGTAMLIPIATLSGPVSIPLVVASSALVGISAIGLSEEERRTKIASGIVAGSLVIWKPGVVGFVLKEAYTATKETAKQTVELAKSSIGLTTTALGTITAIIVGTTTVILVGQNKTTRKRKLNKIIKS